MLTKFVFYVHSSVNYLFILFVQYSIGLSFSYLIFRSFLYILDTDHLSIIYMANIFS